MTKPQLLCVVADAWKKAIQPVISPLASSVFSSITYGAHPSDFASVVQKKQWQSESAPAEPVVFLLGDANSASVLESFSAEHARFDPLWTHSLWTGVDSFNPKRLHAALEALKPTTTCSSPPMPFTNARGTYSEMLAQHCILSTLYFTRQVPRLLRSRRADGGRSFFNDRFASPCTTNMKLTVVGFGDIGKKCAIRMRDGLGVEVVGIRSSGQEKSICPETGIEVLRSDKYLDEVLPASDIVVTVLPAGRRVFTRERLALLKNDAIFINIGRGCSVDESALAEMLDAGRIHAALDVFEKEPLPLDSPLLQVPDERLLATPHNADISHTMKADSAAHFVALAQAAFGSGSGATAAAAAAVAEGKEPNIAVLREQYQVDLLRGY